MTLKELISEFRTIIELDSSGLPGITDEEVILFLDNAQSMFISQRLNGHTVDGSKYPNTQKRIDDLNSLYIFEDTSNFTVSSSTTKNYYDFSLSSLTDYLHFDQATLEVNNVGRFKLERIPSHETARFEYSSINHPYIEKPVFCILGKESGQIIRTYFDLFDAKDQGWTMNLEVGYFTNPTNLVDIYDASGETYDVDDFSYPVYKEIVKIAVDEAILIVSPQRAQVSQQQLNKSE